jgi:hypothetical protein
MTKKEELDKDDPHLLSKVSHNQTILEMEQNIRGGFKV